MPKKRWIIIIITILIVLWLSILYYLYQPLELKDWCTTWYNEICNNDECYCLEVSCTKEGIKCNNIEKLPWYKNIFINNPQEFKDYKCDECDQLNIHYDPNCKLWECLN